MAERARPPKDEIAPIDVPVVVSAKERAKWKRHREALKMTTREFARLANTSHGTVTNVESGVQPTLKRSAYIHYLRATKITMAQAEALTDDEIKRTKELVGRLAMATLALDNDDLAYAAEHLESLARRKLAKSP